MDYNDRTSSMFSGEETCQKNEVADLRFEGIHTEQKNKNRSFIQNIQEYIYSIDYTDGIFTSTYHSDKSLEVTGYTPEEFRQNPQLWFSIIHEDERMLVNDFFIGIITNRETNTIEHRITRKDGQTRWVSNICSAVSSGTGRITLLNGFILDITKRKMSEMRMHLAFSVLDALNNTSVMEDTIREIVMLIKNFFGIEAVGIRHIDGSDYPYDIAVGFPEHFVAEENSLHQCIPERIPAKDKCDSSADDCWCGIVIKNCADPGSRYFTQRGSFWTNNASTMDISKTLPGFNPRMRNRCITEGYESVALIPLRSQERTIGLFQMHDRRQGLFTLDTIEFFEGIGASIGMALSKKMAEKTLLASEEKCRLRNNVMENDLRLAQLVQSRFLNQKMTSTDQVGIEYRYIPFDAVGGDYFSVTPLQEGCMGVFIGDVVGHGISAALFMSLLKAATDRVSRTHGLKPKEYLRQLNSDLIEYLNSTFITAIYGFIFFGDESGGPKFIFSNGGHPRPVHLQSSVLKAGFLDANGTVLGAFPNLEFEEKTVPLSRGDRLFLYTDGIPEAKNEHGQIIGFDELGSLIQQSYRPSLGDMLDRILEHVHEHTGGRAIEDDILLIGFEIL